MPPKRKAAPKAKAASEPGAKRGRGRPKKQVVEEPEEEAEEEVEEKAEEDGGAGDSSAEEGPPTLDAEPASSNEHRWLVPLLTCDEWHKKLEPMFSTPKMREMEKFLEKEYKEKTVFPPKHMIFSAFNITAFDQVKVVILGQDPYHDEGQAHGLSFSVPHGKAVPPSLKNIYKELATDIEGFTAPDHGCLEAWAEEGVLMLNAALTVVAHTPNSHARIGWWEFTDSVIRLLSKEDDHVVFILWGNLAQKKSGLIDESKHTIIKAAHPSPLSVTKFLGSKCFSQANTALKKWGREPVDWTL